jgi:tRNA A-37 threonylcarbamoyl transferase component Bud32
LTLPSPIAYGRTAEIYPWQSGQVLKLFYNWFPLENIEYEARIGRAIHASGLPVPAVGEIVQVDDRTGLIYQRVAGESMLAALSKRPWRLFKYARRAAELHAALHATTIAADIPSLPQKLAYKIQHAAALPEPLRTKSLAALETMPGGDRLCHGDFHPDNILISAGAAVVIDWIDASLGNPLADVARTSVLAVGAVETVQIPGTVPKAIVRIFHSAYLRAYFRLRPGGKDEYQRWLPIVAAARLSENIPEVEHWLIRRAEALP